MPGILDAGGAVVADLDAPRLAAFRAGGVLAGGMLPKVSACQAAAAAGALARIVDGRSAGAIAAALDGRGGTTIRAS